MIVDTLTWAERAEADPTLRAFVDGEIAQAHVELQLLRVECARQQRLIERLDAKLTEARRELKALRAKS